MIFTNHIIKGVHTVKLLKNIYQVGGPSLSHDFDASCYICKAAADEWIMIDCGTPMGFSLIIENINKLGIHPNNIKKILGTHGHYDHIGAAYLFKENYGCALLLHEQDREQVERADVQKTSSFLYGEVPMPCQVDGLLKEGDGFNGAGFSLEVLETPGHTKGSLSFVLANEEFSLLVAGDAVWGGFSDRIGSSETLWRESLQKITSRHFDYYTFGHIGPVLLTDADERLKEAEKAFANYYNPWFKTFYETYRY
jgi:metallo-beta-lactamase class B